MNYLIITYLFFKKYIYLVNNYIDSLQNIKIYNNNKIENANITFLLLNIIKKIMNYIQNIPFIYNRLNIILNNLNKNYELIEYKVDNNIFIYENKRLLDIQENEYKISRCISRIYLSFNLNNNNNIINLKDYLIKYNTTINNKLINILKLNNIEYNDDDIINIEYFKDLQLEKKEYFVKDILYENISDIQ